jgi:aminoglycoside 3-N-acetyltransferase
VRVVKTLPQAGVGKVLKGRLGHSEVLHTTERSISRDPKRLLADVLNIPEDMIHEDLALGMVRNWDSLGHVTLVLAVESLLNRKLADREYVVLTSYKGLRQLLEGKLDQMPIDTNPVTANQDSAAVDGPQDAHREQRDLIAMMQYNRLLPGDSPFAASVQSPRARSSRPIGLSETMDALRKAGLRAGDTVLVHSDVAAIGPTEAGMDRDAILQFYLRAFQEVLTDSGTLAVCTSFEDYGRYGTPFVREESPSRLGAFSEFIRTRPGAVRSVHPIVSITALGSKAKEISAGNHFDGFGYDSPWGRLHRMNAKIVTLGMGQYPNSGITFIHYIEHLYGVPYQYTKIFSAPVISGGGRVDGPFTMSVRYLDFGVTYRTKRFQNVLLDTGDATWSELGTDAVFCCAADRMIAVALECLAKDRYYFLLSAPNFRSGEIPMDGGTGAMRDVYDHSAARGSVG